ncbi:MAG: hypothetical protein GY719_00035 [bacterium]|nr:hypothetical protein [bacterium]
MTTQASLLDQILSGTNRQLQILAAQGLVPLPPEELLPIQVALAESPDPEIAEKARVALQTLEPRVAKSFLVQQAGGRELAFFGIHVQQPAILETILQRRDVPRELLVQVAPSLSPEMQEVLVLRQDAILEEPSILVALERNPDLSSYTKRRIWEYREHLLPKEKVPPKKPEEILAEAEAVTEEEMAEAIEEARERPAEGQSEESTGLTDIQIRSLPIPIRIKMARGANRQVRAILIRDPNVQVALNVMTGNNLPDQEVEQIANSRSVVREVLAEIPKRREWIRKYAIAKAVVKNPRANLATSIGLVPRMTMRDLRDLSRDKNVPDGVRTVARRLFMAKR